MTEMLFHLLMNFFIQKAIPEVGQGFAGGMF
jgi:hypothetical protein